MKYAVMNDRDFVRLLKDNGYVVARTSGDHTIYYNAERKDSITVNNKINPMVARRLIKEHNLKGE
jgi:predicted RNA binding protein YcfA (HicA-like mRNA interferase family)